MINANLAITTPFITAAQTAKEHDVWMRALTDHSDRRCGPEHDPAVGGTRGRALFSHVTPERGGPFRRRASY